MQAASKKPPPLAGGGRGWWGRCRNCLVELGQRDSKHKTCRFPEPKTFTGAFAKFGCHPMERGITRKEMV